MRMECFSARHRPPRTLGSLWQGAYQRQVASAAVPVPDGHKRSLFVPDAPKADTVYIMGPITDAGDAFWFDLWGDTYYTTAEHVRSQMAGVGEKIQVRVNSPGGSVSEGAAIRLLLQEYRAQGGFIEAFVEGIDASASTLATQTADRVVMGDMAAMFVHPVRAFIDVYGYYSSDEIRGDLLPELSMIARHGDADNQTLSRIYADRTGDSPEAMMSLMKKEEWMSADQAVERGLAHEVFKP